MFSDFVDGGLVAGGRVLLFGGAFVFVG